MRVCLPTLVIMSCVMFFQPELVLSAEPDDNTQLIGHPMAESVRFLGSKDRERRGAFVGICAAVSGTRNETYVLVVFRGSDSAYLLLTHRQENAVVTANVATLVIRGDKVEVEETMGGEWTRERMRSVAQQLLHSPLAFVVQYDDLLGKHPELRCVPEG